MDSAQSVFDAYWPGWPEETEGEVLAEIRLGCSINHLVELLWASDSQFQVEVDHARGFVDYVATPWTNDIDELPSLPGGFDWHLDQKTGSSLSTGQASTKHINYTGKMRKVRYDNQGGNGFLGQSFKNEELQRCREHVHSEKMVMEAAVCTTAPYCDRIRVLCRYTLEAVTKKSSFLKVDFHIAYVKNVNGMAKVFMEKGARGGLQKNFEIFVQTLADFVKILSDVEQEDEIDMPSSPVSYTGGYEMINAPRKHLIDWQSLVFPRLSHYFDEALPHLSDAGLGKWSLRFSSSRRPISQLLSIFCFLAVAQIILLLFRMLATLLPVNKPGDGMISNFHWLLDVPDTLGELFSAALLLEIVYWIVNFLSDSMANIGSWVREPIRAALVSPEFTGDQPASKIKTETKETTVPNSPIAEATVASSDNNLSLSPSMNQLSQKFSGSARMQMNPSPLPRSDASMDVVDEPSIIDNTVSFFRLGVVTAALGVELALSGITKSLQPASVSSEENQDEDTIGVERELCSSSTVLEDIFENERYQPFRGWGHTWPGHFLPTDRCGHWSTHSPTHEFLATSMVFSDLEPQLPEGWRWVEPDWQLDLSGRDMDAVDKEGWQYGVDFSWIKFPAEAGRGKNMNMRLIRRRRWTRIRTRLDAGVPPTLSMVNALQSSRSDCPDSNITEPLARFIAQPCRQKAMSEGSYFADDCSTTKVGPSVANTLEVPAGKLHRRKSSACTMERYFSIDDSYHSIKAQSFDIKEQGCSQGGTSACPVYSPADADKSRSNDLPANYNSLNRISNEEPRVWKAFEEVNYRTAWSDSGERIQESNHSRGIQRVASAGFQEKRFVHSKDEPHQEVISDTNNGGHTDVDSSPSLSETESYASYDPNWACMEGSKWVNECKGSVECNPWNPDLL